MLRTFMSCLQTCFLMCNNTFLRLTEALLAIVQTSAFIWRSQGLISSLLKELSNQKTIVSDSSNQLYPDLICFPLGIVLTVPGIRKKQLC